MWDFGDGDRGESTEPYTPHAWTAPGDYLVVLRAYNESYPGGVSATVTIHVVTQPVHYVAVEQHQSGAALHLLGHGGHEHPGCGGCASVPGALVLVTNGDLRRGGVQPGGDGQAADGAERQRPEFTVINGGGASFGAFT